jgi:Tol biopolymer transport system component
VSILVRDFARGKRSKKVLGGAALLFALAAFGASLPALSAPGAARTDLVSRAPGLHGAAADGDSSSASISADGRYVAFASKAANLSGADRNGTVDIFVRDMKTGAVTLVSRADGVNGAAGDQDSFSPHISADGRYVAFTSLAANLGTPSVNSEVYVRDLVAGTTTLASRGPGPAGAPGNAANEPDLSADGRHVVWTDFASLVPADTNDELDVYARDLDTNTTELISRPTDPTAAATEGSTSPAVSADGRYVAFTSRDHLGTPDGESPFETTLDVFVRDRATATTSLVSVPGPGSRGCEPDYPTIADSGRYVAYECNQIWVRDLVAGTTTRATRTIGVSGPGDPPSITPDGRYLAFVSNYRQDSPLVISGKEVYVRDLQQGVTVDAARANGLGVLGDTSSMAPSLSADGRFVAFSSFARNFSPIDGDKTNDVWRRKLVYTPDKPLPTCDDRPVTLIGTKGRDVLRGGPRPDVILGLGGNDRINGAGSADLICGAGGRDIVNGGKRASSHGDSIFGGPGADRLTIIVGGGSVSGGPGDDRIRGSNTNDSGDTLRGGPGHDVILGLNNASYNDDFIYGGSGPDSLFGGRGPDVMAGGPGNDLIRGGQGDDRITGGPGNDDISFGPGQH